MGRNSVSRPITTEPLGTEEQTTKLLDYLLKRGSPRGCRATGRFEWPKWADFQVWGLLYLVERGAIWASKLGKSTGLGVGERKSFIPNKERSTLLITS